ncbi:winged helix-turn-helix transcriptional regulator [Levilactobacillus zymae]|uniref:winged helix-turn-helix transcriptional regulator n=1 Tax=Levilactobacillus zymae TaxID=267363 RepID=UPI0028B576BB|nr:winged helix-turn-helix transcriptional regulator [Levilactobacillus zymae]MDT6979649.1 winged helix-turn-helix transcriptional regulator [Levilactobacillus zymae]
MTTTTKPYPAELRPLNAALSLLDSPWKSLILYRLTDHDYRFTELHRTLAACPQATLASQLAQLVQDQLVVADHNSASAITYSLSRAGRSLVPLLLALNRWGRVYLRENQLVTLTHHDS